MDDELLEAYTVRAVSRGSFGSGLEFLSLTPKQEQPKVNHHFCSTLRFFTVRFRDGSSRDVVVKRHPTLKAQRELQNTPVQFQNEVYFYERVLPVLNQGGVLDNLFPRCYYGVGTGNHESDVLVLEDLSGAGFESGRLRRAHLDHDHCKLVLQQLAFFHAQSYLARGRDPDAFERVASKLQEAYLTFKEKNFFAFLARSFRRGIDPLIQRGVEIERLSAFLDRASDMFAFYADLITPESNTGVVCHGDLCNINILFKYSANGRPVDLQFVDLQRAKYSSPTVDLSVLLYLHLDPDTRSRHWDEFIDFYYESLSKAVPRGLVPSREEFLAEFSRKAAFGYLINSFYIPLMTTDQHPDEIASELPDKELIELLINVGGEECTRLLTQLVSHMLRKNYI
ncbi:hypothetical protein AAG570_004171 [Ranatra chinensis]|uniref:CHK kinase-like domain-containing protein n=1 Tax=Ranatra chinensis TaxID=642074 RepID=A0ABD0Y311_9HEMI